ncbi:MAG: hypothetical protein B7Y61_07250 [Rhizobiales bacterium 35-66-30]|jgi:hypothetical protein|nr:MAG: hypothetical protein B7Y61_07250 [Rhizobiales bacterium 35-66-30]OZB04754.1 MAG: hypothetical protein B7X67_13480 [Rhizobiales bacterium 39-66-18]
MLDRAQHEFGHHIVGRAVGFDTGDVSAEFSATAGGYAVIITNRTVATISDVEQFCEDRIKVLYAGVLAETLKGGVIDGEAAVKLAYTTGSVDHKMVQQLCNLLRNIRYSIETMVIAEEKMQADETRLWNEAADLVGMYASAIQDLAKELYDRRFLAGKMAIMTEAELRVHPLILKHFP